MHDSESKGISAHVATQKGTDEHLCLKVVEDLDNMGNKDIISMVSANGKTRLNLPGGSTSVRDPAWTP